MSAGLARGSVLGSLPLNIFINDILFLQKNDLANCADDSTLYTSDKPVSTIIDSLSHQFTITSCFLTQLNDSLQTNLVCGDGILKSTKQEKVLGLTLDNKLNFATHLLNISKDASKKFNALTRVQKYMTTDQKRLIFSSFINCNLPTIC